MTLLKVENNYLVFLVNINIYITVDFIMSELAIQGIALQNSGP
jgi:hypothetical protein